MLHRKLRNHGARRNTPLLKIAITLVMLFGMGSLLWLPGASAQDGEAITPSPSPTPTNTPAPISVTRYEPTQINLGQSAVLSVFGANFTSNTTVRLVGFGFLTTTLINSTALSVTLPNGLAAGAYSLEVSDPLGGTVLLPEPLIVNAPTATPQPSQTPVAYIAAYRYEPVQIRSDATNQITVYGANFTALTTVRLVGFGLLPTTLVNSVTLNVAMPDGMQAGQYSLEVSDPVGGSALLTTPLTVTAPIVPTPTFQHLDPPTPMPGQPSLVARNFSTRPAQSAPGDTITLTFEVVNQGNRVAEGVSVSIDGGGNFVPAQGSASATLASILPGGSANVALSVIAGMEAPAGANSVPVTMTYRDFSGEIYTSKTTLSVQIVPVSEASQVVVEEYSIAPDPAKPGQAVTVNVRLVNRGNETAAQVLLRVAGAESVLLAGDRGDSFPAGDLEPGASVELSLPLIVSMEAKAGPQAQPLTITYLQKGENKEAASSLTVEIEAVIEAEPLILLESYDTGKETLLPGEQFTLDLTIKNMGAGEATELLVVFGTVEAQSNGGSDDGSGDGSGSPSQTSTTPSNTFAPLGTGGTQYVGVLASNGGSVALSQDFIVNGTVTSGVYSLPISLLYKKADGSSVQNNLRASVVVVVPPRFQMTLQVPIMEMINVGEPIPVALTLLNMGKNTVNLTSATLSGENIEVLDGKEIALGAVKTEKDTTLSGTVMAQAEGAVKIVVTINYLDELNRPQTIEQVYESTAVLPPPPPDFEPMPEMPAPVEETEEEDDTLGRIILGLLGLGS